ncbi:choice-of-anchor M domain-containing protein [Dactylosporangium sp. CA-233914]|uniref:choice-of-anchor M domain-containing protein n=1 Tax=Dactylosporangium sp. CA-233914 TaxID=3239934 RepID=UPI003D8FCCAF
MHRYRTAAAVLAAALAVGVSPPGAWASPSDDPQLSQSLDPNQQIVHGERVLQIGHVDMGPRFDNGHWRFLIHDDARKADPGAASVWRYPDETVLQVADAARLPVPADPSYTFIGAEPATPVWVVPQTQNPGVVWVGWNTQDPQVMQRIDRGVTMSLTGVQGPGIVTVYLNSGDFGKPQILWDSRKTEPQPVWVDANTHTHANWVFTKPGVYLLQLQVKAQLRDGTTASDTQLIRFAVGTATPSADALTATWSGTVAGDTSAPPASSAGVARGPDPAGASPVSWPLVTIVLVAAAGLVVGSIVAIRARRARRRVLAARAGSGR